MRGFGFEFISRNYFVNDETGLAPCFRDLEIIFFIPDHFQSNKANDIFKALATMAMAAIFHQTLR